MSTKSRHLRGFSLIEVSVVILIIGILIAGAFAGLSLIKKARIQAAQTLTKSSPIAGISSNALWLESSLGDSFLDSESNDTAAVSTWNDQKVTGSKSSITKVGNGPTYANTINYVHAVKFTETVSDTNYLKIADASFLNGTDYTIVVLEKRQKASAGYFLSTTNSSDVVDNKLAIGYASDGVIAHSHNSTNYTVTPKVSAYANSTETPRLFVFTQSATDGRKTYINGTLAAQDTSKTTLLSGVTTLAIGKGYTGEIGEIAIFTKALSSPDRKLIEDYLAKKWTRKLNRSAVSGSITGGSDTSGNPSCINGTVTDSASSGCDNSCTVSVNGVSTPSLVDDATTGILTCNSSLGYSGTVSYSCSGGDLHPVGSCTGITCDITSVTGFNDKPNLDYAASATVITSPCATNYTASTSPAPSYTCISSGHATIVSGTCTLSIPSNSVAPTLSASSAAVGTAISVSSTGTWAPTPSSYTYAWWWSDGTPAAISGATSSSYTPVSGDAGHTLICKVAATNTTGTSSAVSSNATSAVTNIPVNSVAPALSSTSPSVGTAVTVTTGTWSASPTSYTYAWWWADGTPAAISGATSSSYTPVAGDLTHTLLCKVTATGSGGTSSAVSSNTSSAVEAFVACTGGGITTYGSYTVHTFISSTSPKTFTCPSARNVEVLVAAGGGGGSGGYLGAGGSGGGAGGLIYNSSFAVSTSAITVTIGAGGAGGAASTYNNGGNGTNSVFSSLTAIGGGGGGGRDRAGSSGGSGGGAGISSLLFSAAAGTSGQGNAGGANFSSGPNYGGGGGGGAGAVGQTGTSTKGGNGGVGLSYSITGTSTYYGGGGGSSYYSSGGTQGTGGSGGGGNPGQVGTANTGGGGGGGANDTDSGKSGGSGIVIVRYVN